MLSLLLIPFSYAVFKINAISDYTLVNVAAPGLTTSEANDYCHREYDTTLATINTQSDYNSAKHISINGNPTNGNLQLTTTGGSSEWWFAVEISGLPDGYKIGTFEVEHNNGWKKCHIANWATSCTAGNPKFNGPLLTIRITATNGEQIVANGEYKDGKVWDLQSKFGSPIEEPWIGMVNKKNEPCPPFFEWLSDDSCSEAPTGACVPARFWVGKQPINCDESGTDCVVFYEEGFNNNIECDTPRRTFLCNRNLYPEQPAAHIVDINELKGFGANESYMGGISNWTLVWILLALSVMCNMVYSIYCLYVKWCKNRNRENKRYNFVGDEDDVEGLNDI